MLLDPRHLDQLSVIIDVGTLQEAAKQIGTSQPALSRMIGILESRIGMPLFERTTRPLKPTPLGEELANQGRAIRTARLRALEVADFGARGFFGVLKIGAPPFLCERLVSEAIASFVVARPEVRVDVIPDYYAGLQEKMFQNQLDIIIVPTKFADQARSDLVFEPLFSDVNAFVGRSGHPLLAKAKIDVTDLERMTWIGHSERSVLRSDMETSLKLLGVKNIRFAFQSESAGAVIQLLRNTDFLTMLPRYAIKMRAKDGLEILPIDLPNPEQLVSMVTLAEREETKLVSDFKAHIREHFSDGASL